MPSWKKSQIPSTQELDYPNFQFNLTIAKNQASSVGMDDCLFQDFRSKKPGIIFHD
jgi:hypothetical protein